MAEMAAAAPAMHLGARIAEVAVGRGADRAFAGDPAKAEALVRGQQTALVVFCRTANDFTKYRRARKDGLAAQLYAGTPPAWLETVPIRSRAGLAVWRVKPE